MTPFAIKLIGHTCEVIGGLGFAYEVLTGYPNRNRKEVAERQLKQLQGFLKDTEKRINDLADTYPDPEKEKADLRQKWAANIAELEKRVNKHGDRYELISFLLGWAGAVVLLIGFALQLVAELMEA